MRHVHVQKIVLIALLSLVAWASKAQLNYIEKGNKTIYFGIHAAVNYADFRVKRTPNSILNDTIRGIESRFGPGFNLGIIGNYQFHEYFDLRLIPTLMFSDKTIEYMEKDGSSTRKTVPSIYLSFPLTLRYKAKPIKDFRMFVLAGIRYDFDLNANSNKRNADDQILVRRHDLQAEFGFGFQFYFPYFILSPEFKVSHGMFDIKAPNEDLIYSRVVDRLFSRMFTISFNIEG